MKADLQYEKLPVNKKNKLYKEFDKLGFTRNRT